MCFERNSRAGLQFSFPARKCPCHHSAPHNSVQSAHPVSGIFPIRSVVPVRSGNHAHRKRRRLTNMQTASPSSEHMSSLVAIHEIQSGCYPSLPQQQSACHRLSTANNRQTWVCCEPRYCLGSGNLRQKIPFRHSFSIDLHLRSKPESACLPGFRPHSFIKTANNIAFQTKRVLFSKIGTNPFPSLSRTFEIGNPRNGSGTLTPPPTYRRTYSGESHNTVSRRPSGTKAYSPQASVRRKQDITKKYRKLRRELPIHIKEDIKTRISNIAPTHSGNRPI